MPVSTPESENPLDNASFEIASGMVDLKSDFLANLLEKNAEATATKFYAHGLPEKAQQALKSHNVAAKSLELPSKALSGVYYFQEAKSYGSQTPGFDTVKGLAAEHVLYKGIEKGLSKPGAASGIMLASNIWDYAADILEEQRPEVNWQDPMSQKNYLEHLDNEGTANAFKVPARVVNGIIGLCMGNPKAQKEWQETKAFFQKPKTLHMKLGNTGQINPPPLFKTSTKIFITYRKRLMSL